MGACNSRQAGRTWHYTSWPLCLFWHKNSQEFPQDLQYCLLPELRVVECVAHTLLSCQLSAASRLSKTRNLRSRVCGKRYHLISIKQEFSHTCYFLMRTPLNCHGLHCPPVFTMAQLIKPCKPLSISLFSLVDHCKYDETHAPYKEKRFWF